MRDDVKRLIDAIRPAFGRLSPMLSAAGWSAADIDEINDVVIGHRDSGNVPALTAARDWIEAKTAELQARPDVQYAMQRAQEVAVVPSVRPKERARPQGR